MKGMNVGVVNSAISTPLKGPQQRILDGLADMFYALCRAQGLSLLSGGQEGTIKHVKISGGTAFMRLCRIPERTPKAMLSVSCSTP